MTAAKHRSERTAMLYRLLADAGAAGVSTPRLVELAAPPGVFTNPLGLGIVVDKRLRQSYLCQYRRS